MVFRQLILGSDSNSIPLQERNMQKVQLKRFVKRDKPIDWVAKLILLGFTCKIVWFYDWLLGAKSNYDFIFSSDIEYRFPPVVLKD